MRSGKGMRLEVPELGKHDYDGSYAPGNSWYHPDTFSVGIFKWVPRLDGKPKRSPVIIRVKGFFDYPRAVHRVANELCEKLDNGWTPDQKTYDAGVRGW